jgi:DNA-binding NarL/FixJ family response regulator
LPESSLRIFIADEHEIVRRGMASLLSSHPGWEVCGEAADGAGAVEKIAQLRPDIVLLDIAMPNMDGLEVMRKIAHNPPFPKVILLSLTDVEQLVREALQAGARGFVMKTYASRDLVPAVEMLQQDRTFLPPRITEMIVQGYLKGETAKDKSEKNEGMGSGDATEEPAAFHHGKWSRNRAGRIGKFLGITALLLVTAAIAWYTDVGKSDSSRLMVDKWFVRAGLKTPSAPIYNGNPDIKVWIDLHTALYYCPGSALYGKTPRGRFAKQRDAQLDQFEPASRSVCE